MGSWTFPDSMAGSLLETFLPLRLRDWKSTDREAFNRGRLIAVLLLEAAPFSVLGPPIVAVLQVSAMPPNFVGDGVPVAYTFVKFSLILCGARVET